ncbi:2413_t:CDS:2 [Funneliformis mosseae]|uniref:2413_t:CDS:1 n=1 Tax=Funneliformis mosseae TaxID=27381 RepID=A0A9N9GSY9_FUNMO|nr:2413_t:CDS:2 [Funneliformis mosseae]
MLSDDTGHFEKVNVSTDHESSDLSILIFLNLRLDVSEKLPQDNWFVVAKRS